MIQIAVCRRWLESNRHRFNKTDLLTTNINTGVSANANRGLKAATGEWIKFIGSDDTLQPDCLTDNMHFIADHPYIRILFSRIAIYHQSFIPENYLETTPGREISPQSIFWPERSAESQYRMLLTADRIHFSPSVFLHRETVILMGGFDERFRLLEDYPLWLTLTRNGHKLFFMDKVTVNYRRHSKAINNTGKSVLINPNYFRSETFRRIYTYPFLPRLVRSEQQYRWIVSQFFRCNLFNRSNLFTRRLYELLAIYLNPFRYAIKLKSVLKRDNVSD